MLRHIIIITIITLQLIPTIIHYRHSLTPLRSMTWTVGMPIHPNVHLCIARLLALGIFDPLS
jgi:hypothetical protein